MPPGWWSIWWLRQDKSRQEGKTKSIGISNFHGGKLEKLLAECELKPQVILRWHTQMGFTVIPGSTNPDHIRDNAGIFDFTLTDEEAEGRFFKSDRRELMIVCPTYNNTSPEK